MASDIDYSDASSDADSDFEVARHNGKVIPERVADCTLLRTSLS